MRNPPEKRIAELIFNHPHRPTTDDAGNSSYGISAEAGILKLLSISAADWARPILQRELGRTSAWNPCILCFDAACTTPHKRRPEYLLKMTTVGQLGMTGTTSR